MDKIAFLYAVAARSTGISLANALGLLEDAERFMVTETPTKVDLSDPAALIAFARTLPEVKAFLRDGKKIQAIKELRTQGQNVAGRDGAGYSIVGLKQAKDAVDALGKEFEYQPTYRACCGGSGRHYSYCLNY